MDSGLAQERAPERRKISMNHLPQSIGRAVDEHKAILQSTAPSKNFLNAGSV
jgi:hypothetical protein